MSLNNDTPISGLPEKQRNPIFDDLLITSQLIAPGQYFTAKLTIASVYTLFMADIKISDVKLLQQTLDAMQVDIDGKLDGSHTHVIAEVTGLQNALDNKAAVNHSHTIGQIAGLQAALDSKLDNATHIHTISQVTGLQAALNQKSALNHTHDMSEITNLVQALAGKLNVSLKGVANGLAELDTSGRVPLTQSHLFIIERTNSSFFPTVGEGGKFYVDMQTGVSYRWNGAAYVPLSTGQDYLQLGETSTTAYRGDRGKAAYDHSQSTHAPLDAQKNVQSDWNATSGDAMILNKPATMPPSAHTHAYADLTGTKPPVDAEKNVQVDWFAASGITSIRNKPATFAPTSHSHDYNEISGSKPPVDAQKNSNITKAEIEAKLVGNITSHTHTLPTASTSEAGIVQLNDTLTSTSTSEALTAAQGKVLKDLIDAGGNISAEDVLNLTLTGLDVSAAPSSTISAANTILQAFARLQKQINNFGSHSHDGIVDFGGEEYYPYVVGDGLLYNTQQTITVQPGYYRLVIHSTPTMTNTGGFDGYQVHVTRVSTGEIIIDTHDIVTKKNWISEISKLAVGGFKNQSSTYQNITEWVYSDVTQFKNNVSGDWENNDEGLYYLFDTSHQITRPAQIINAWEGFGDWGVGKAIVSSIFHFIEPTDLLLTIPVMEYDENYHDPTWGGTSSVGKGYVWIREVDTP